MAGNTLLKKRYISAVVFGIFVFAFSPTATHAAIKLSGPTTDGLVGWWTFDANSFRGATTSDRNPTLTKHDGLLVGGATSVKGKISQGVRLNGSTGQVTVLDHSDFAFGSGNFTMAAWVNTESTAGEYSIMSKDNVTTQMIYYSLRVLPGGSYWFAIYNQAGCPSGTNVSSPLAYPAGQWHHVAGVRDGSGSLKLYVDGRLVNSVSGTACGSVTNGDKLRIGAMRPSQSDWFLGSIDDARIYNRALSASEIYGIYQYGSAKVNVNSGGVAKDKLTNGLVGWWTFDGGDMTSTVAFDKSGSIPTNTGTLTSTSKVSGKIGQGLSFNGSTAKVLVADSASVKFGAGSFSYGAWVKSTNNVSNKTILAKDADASGASRKFYRLFRNNTTFGPNCDIYDGAQTPAIISTGNITPNTFDGKWHHYMCVNDASAKILYMYVDGGRQVYKTSYSTAYNTDNVGSLGMMYYPYGTAMALDGSLDDVRIYSRPLSANEVYSLYQYGNAKINVASQAVANQGTKSGLVGHWTFNGADTIKGTTIPYTFLDKSGSGNTATTTSSGGTMLPGKIGQGFGMSSASSQWATAMDSDSLSITGDITIAAWVKTSDFTIEHSIVGKTGPSHAKPYDYYVQTNGTMAFYMGNGSGSTGVSSAGAVPSGKWTFVSVTRSGTSVKHYINGIRSGGSESFSPTITDNGLPLGIGTRNDNYTKMNGALDDVRIYSRALSANEIYSLYTEGK